MEKREKTSIDKLVESQWMTLATQQRQKAPGIALSAVKYFYKEHGLDKDPIIMRSLENASVGLSESNITDAGILESMEYWKKEHEDAYDNAKVSDILEVAKKNGYEHKALDKVKKAYGDITYKDLFEKAEDKEKVDEDAQKAVLALKLVDTQQFEVQLYGAIVKDYTKGITENINSKLENLYAKEE